MVRDYFTLLNFLFLLSNHKQLFDPVLADLEMLRESIFSTLKAPQVDSCIYFN